jgi:biopolymer transport protein ExbB/TolQ
MNVWQFLVPDSPVASFIVVILMALVAIWYGVLVYWTVALSRRQRELRRCIDVVSLNIQSKDLSARSATASGPDLAALEVEADVVFREFCREKDINPEGLTARHLKAIFDAGWKGSRLDVGELIKHTSGNLYRTHALLRSVLAVFIIVGLLGTLFGLSSSLAQLSPLSVGGSVQSATQLSQGLNHLLVELRSAFAPSIWGVLVTFICVLVLSSYVHLKALPVKHDLERFTFTIWVPQLFPATSRRFLEALHLSEGHMQKSFEIARELAGFTRDIRTEVSNFRDNLLSANKPLKVLAESSTNLNKFTDTFAVSVEKIGSFQVELKALYEQMVTESQTFHGSVKQNIKKSGEFQAGIQVAMKSQGEQIKSLMVSMKSHEHAYIESRVQLDAALMEVLSEAKKSYSAVVSQNRILANEVGEPLRKSLTTSLSNVEGALRERLQKEQTQLDEVMASVTNLVRTAEGSRQETMRSTNEIAAAMQQSILQQGRTQEEGLRQLKDTDQMARTMMTNLAVINQAQVETLKVFSQTVSELTSTIKGLSENLTPIDPASFDRSGNGNVRSSPSGVLRPSPPMNTVPAESDSLTQGESSAGERSPDTGPDAREFNSPDSSESGNAASASSSSNSGFLSFLSRYK